MYKAIFVATRLSISDFPFQWHLSDQKVILLIILYQQGFINVFTSQTSGPSLTVRKLERQIFGTIGDGPIVGTFQSLGCPKFWDIGTKMDILAIHKWQNSHFCPNVPNFGTVGNRSENLTSQLRDRRRRSRRITSYPAPHPPSPLVWNSSPLSGEGLSQGPHVTLLSVVILVLSNNQRYSPFNSQTNS